MTTNGITAQIQFTNDGQTGKASVEFHTVSSSKNSSSTPNAVYSTVFVHEETGDLLGDDLIIMYYGTSCYFITMLLA